MAPLSPMMRIINGYGIGALSGLEAEIVSRLHAARGWGAPRGYLRAKHSNRYLQGASGRFAGELETVYLSSSPSHGETPDAEPV